MIVLDTHAWIWWIGDPDSLSPTARDLIKKEIDRTQVYLSSISAWEAALLVSRGRLRLSMDIETWIQRSEALPFLKFVPVDNAIASRSVLLPEPLHSDPADRIIIATALRLGALLVTKDQKIQDYPHVRTIW